MTRFPTRISAHFRSDDEPQNALKIMVNLRSRHAAVRYAGIKCSQQLREESQVLKQELKPVSLPSWPMLSSGIEFKRTSPIVEIDAQ
jgi:hypothetical protein